MTSKDFYVEPKGAAVNENRLRQAVFRNIDCEMWIRQGILNDSMRRRTAALGISGTILLSVIFENLCRDQPDWMRPEFCAMYSEN